MLAAAYPLLANLLFQKPQNGIKDIEKVTKTELSAPYFHFEGLKRHDKAEACPTTFLVPYPFLFGPHPELMVTMIKLDRHAGEYITG